MTKDKFEIEYKEKSGSVWRHHSFFSKEEEFEKALDTFEKLSKNLNYEYREGSLS